MNAIKQVITPSEPMTAILADMDGNPLHLPVVALALTTDSDQLVPMVVSGGYAVLADSLTHCELVGLEHSRDGEEE